MSAFPSAESSRFDHLRPLPALATPFDPFSHPVFRTGRCGFRSTAGHSSRSVYWSDASRPSLWSEVRGSAGTWRVAHLLGSEPHYRLRPCPASPNGNGSVSGRSSRVAASMIMSAPARRRAGRSALQLPAGPLLRRGRLRNSPVRTGRASPLPRSGGSCLAYPTRARDL